MDRELQRRLGALARTARERMGLTQAQVARQVGLAPAVYGRIERGDMMPSVPSLRRICLALDISADALLDLSAASVSAHVDAVPSEPQLSPVLRRILHRLRTWPEARLKALDKVLNVLASTFEP